MKTPGNVTCLASDGAQGSRRTRVSSVSPPRVAGYTPPRKPGACYSAHRCLPRRDSHPLDTRSKQTPDSPVDSRLRHDAPWSEYSGAPGVSAGSGGVTPSGRERVRLEEFHDLRRGPGRIDLPAGVDEGDDRRVLRRRVERAAGAAALSRPCRAVERAHRLDRLLHV